MRQTGLATIVVLLIAASVAFAHPGGVDADGCHRDGPDKRHCHPERARNQRASQATLSQPPKSGEEGVFEGSLLWVTDGDSLRALIRGRDTEVRLTDIDAPERDQPYGWQAKLQLIDLVRDRHLLVVPSDVDQYGRIVARVWAGDVDINRELVARGSAWFYPQYADDKALYDVEQEARNAKRGLWHLPVKERMEPWLWRRNAKGR